MLATRSATQNLQNTLSVIPSQRRLLQARADRSARDLKYTRIAAPFDTRLAELSVEADQYVGVGQGLFQGDAVDRVEIKPQVAMSALRRLFLGRGSVQL
jgi:multidrug resistance efflux pump